MTLPDIELIGVPFDGYGRLGNQARAPGALRSAGIGRVFGTRRVVADADVELPPPDPARGAQTTLLNEPALVAMTTALAQRVGAALAAGVFPVVFGGDCSALLGIVAGLRRRSPEIGLVFVDGHEDTMPLDVSEDGEAANTEIGLLLGLTGRTLKGPLRESVSVLPADRLVVLGPRDAAWRAQFNVGTLANCGVWVAPLAGLAADPVGTAHQAVAALAAASSHWWLHIDLDVLDPVEFPAQGLPDVPDEPGGLRWEQLTDLAGVVLSSGRCIGLSLVIYDPDQDPGASGARRIVAFLGEAMGRIPPR
ncbi:arginase family protein [Mycolicibacterium goodii]|uniref:Arginase n=1 Tax=Mycolicibacterium goodii TaxID=134601 RepID=A0A0K0XCA1_MYCGD|nr:arginase [Mycolicibacterium goodii]